MGDYERCLPFARGTTICDGVKTAANDQFKDLLGKVYEVNDTVHLSGLPVKLRVVQNDSAATITMARKGVAFDTTAGDFGRKVSGLVATSGGKGKPMDDAMTVGASILDHDCFYVVEAGPCYVLSETTGVALSAHSLVQFDNGGRMDGAVPSANNFCFGVVDAAAANTDVSVLVHVIEGFGGGEGT